MTISANGTDLSKEKNNRYMNQKKPATADGRNSESELIMCSVLVESVCERIIVLRAESECVMLIIACS